jgi:DNA repair protein RadC
MMNKREIDESTYLKFFFAKNRLINHPVTSNHSVDSNFVQKRF